MLNLDTHVLLHAVAGSLRPRETRLLTTDRWSISAIIMVIGSSGYSTFVDQVGDLSSVLDKCLGANILLVNPYSQDPAHASTP